MTFSQRLNQLRIQNNFTQKYLANYMQVSQATISNWERAIKEPTIQEIIDLAAFFGVSCDFLLGVVD